VLKRTYLMTDCDLPGPACYKQTRNALELSRFAAVAAISSKQWGTTWRARRASL